jgi:hypothetical protein
MLLTSQYSTSPDGKKMNSTENAIGMICITFACTGSLIGVGESFGADRFPSPPRLDDAAWVAFRLAEVLPLELEFKQQLLESSDPVARLDRLKEFLQSRSVVV